MSSAHLKAPFPFCIEERNGVQAGGLPYDARFSGSGDFVKTMLQEAEEKMARQVRYHAGKGSIAAVIKDL